MPVLIVIASAADPILVTAGPDTLYRNELRIQLKLQNVSDVAPENLQPMLEHWIDRTALYRQAQREGLGSDETTRALLDESRRQYVLGLMTKRITDSIKVSDNEIFDYYNRHKLDFSARLRFQFMVLEDEKAAKQAAADVARGKDFVAIAAERSLYRAKAPTAETLLVGRNDTLLSLDPLFEDTIYSLPKDKVSLPIKVGNTWWLVKPVERTYLGATPGPDQVREYISKLLELKHKRAALEHALAALEKKTKVVRTAPKGDTSGFLAAVGNSVLTRHYLNLQMPDKTELNPKDLPQLVNIWSRSELLYQEAGRLGLGADETTRVLLKEKERDYIADMLIQRIVDKITVPGTEVFDYFQQHKDEFIFNVKLIHILLGSDSLAEAIMDEIKKGADFQALASQRSYDRNLAQGSESRFLGRLDPNLGLDPLLEDVIFRLTPGMVSPIIHTREGYWIVKITDRKQVLNTVTYEQAQERIHNFLYARKSEQTLNDLLAGLKQNVPTRMFPANYWN
jgi:peptidyl-prolyl cis-trans isomerase C